MSRSIRARTGGCAALVISGLLFLPTPGVADPLPAPTSFGHRIVSPNLVAHAEGAQLYECKPDASGVTAWTFREPIATLISNGKTIGRHYAGPTWELNDSSRIRGKLLATAPGATPSDIPLLKLNVAEHHGEGALNGVNQVLRLDTRGGNLKGACRTAGELRAEPYSADYEFLP